MSPFQDGHLGEFLQLVDLTGKYFTQFIPRCQIDTTPLKNPEKLTDFHRIEGRQRPCEPPIFYMEYLTEMLFLFTRVRPLLPRVPVR